MYEHRSKPLLSLAEFFWRVVRHSALAFAILFVALGIGILGYHWSEGLPWIDSFLNACMILGGMGPVDTLQHDKGKLFASFYALFSGILFIVVMGFLLAPFVHRLMHRLHLEDEAQEKPDAAE